MTAADRGETEESARLARAFEADIRPQVPALAARREALASGFRGEVAAVAVAAAASAAAAILSGVPVFVIFVLLVATAALALLYVRRRRVWTQAALEAVVPAAARALGETRHSPDGSADLLRDFEAVGLVGAARHRIVAHGIEGKRAGTRFQAAHATLARTRGRRGGATRLFHGLLLAVSVPVAPPGRIVIVPAQESMTQVFAGVVRSLLPPSHDRVELGDPEFEARFQVLADAQEPAAAERVRAYLSRAFREALLAIDREEARATDGRPAIRAAFEGERFLLALPRVDRPGWGPFRRERLRPFLDPGGLFARDDLAVRLRLMAEELGTPHRIVDRLVQG